MRPPSTRRPARLSTRRPPSTCAAILFAQDTAMNFPTTSPIVIALLLAAVLVVAAVLARPRGSQDSMAVYGKSFADLPHGNLQAASAKISRVARTAPPNFKGKKAYGASFAHL